MRTFKNYKTTVISIDSYYFDNSKLTDSERMNFNFDEPSAIDFDYLISDLNKIMKGELIEVPLYDYTSTSRKNSGLFIFKPDILIIEGLFLFNQERIKDMLDVSVYINLEEEERRKRIIDRDKKFRGKSVEEIEYRINNIVFPMHEKYVQPQMKIADFIVEDNFDNLIDDINNMLFLK